MSPLLNSIPSLHQVRRHTRWWEKNPPWCIDRVVPGMAEPTGSHNIPARGVARPYSSSPRHGRQRGRGVPKPSSGSDCSCKLGGWPGCMRPCLDARATPSISDGNRTCIAARHVFEALCCQSRQEDGLPGMSPASRHVAMHNLCAPQGFFSLPTCCLSACAYSPRNPWRAGTAAFLCVCLHAASASSALCSSTFAACASALLFTPPA